LPVDGFSRSKKLLEGTIRQALGEQPRVELAAVDSTGMESRHISRYFVRRRSRLATLWQTTYYTKYPKLGVVCDCQSHIILSTLRKRGPTPDINQLRQTLRPAVGRAQIKTLLADAGYDSEANHTFTREQLGIETIIPPRHGRPSIRPPTGKYRRLMREELDTERYGQRWQVETVFSMIKRNLGSALHGRSYWSQCRELMLLAITHNIMIIMLVELFYRAVLPPFSGAVKEYDP
jgi:transposase